MRAWTVDADDIQIADDLKNGSEEEDRFLRLFGIVEPRR